MTGLTQDDLSVIEGDARVTCRRLADALGYKFIKNVHAIIERRADELADFGEVFTLEGKNSSPKGGRPQKTYMLNEQQAVALAMWANTETARKARMQIVEVFVAWRRGDLHGLAAMRQSSRYPVQTKHDPDIFEACADRAENSLRHLNSLSDIDALSREVTHLPIWTKKLNRRPRWWRDLEVREYLTVTHRQMSILEAEAEGQKLFGARCPKKSAICDYWLRLDKAKRIVSEKRDLGPTDPADGAS